MLWGEQKISIRDFPISTSKLPAMIHPINEGTISSKIAKEVFAEMLKSNEEPKTIVARKGLIQISDESVIEKIVVDVLEKTRLKSKSILPAAKKCLAFLWAKL